MEFAFKNILKESRLLREGRKEDAREKYPNIPEKIFNVFVEGDPSGNQKYLMWLCGIWEEENAGWSYRFGNVGDARVLMENINYFHSQTQKFEKKDINQYQTTREFKNAVTEAKKNLTRGEIKKSAKKIYESGNHLVVIPLTHAASCYYGSGTRWCTTSRENPGYYLNYTSKGTLFYYINKRTGKKRAFYTPFTATFLHPSTVAGSSHRDLGHTEVYTETDSRGRSLRGIPTDARQAMNQEHQKGFDNYLNTLSEKEKIDVLISAGLPLPAGYTTYEGDYEHSKNPPKQLTKIKGSIDMQYSINSLENITTITGDLNIRSNFDFGKLKFVGGNIQKLGYWSNVPLSDLGELKIVRGTFMVSDFRIDDLKEKLSKLEHVGKLIVSPSQLNELVDDVRIPGLPNTKVKTS